MCDESISVCDVLYLRCFYCNPPKDKFYVVVALDPRPLLLIVNSKLNNYVLSNENLISCNKKISLNGHEGFLRYDSWIDCCNVVEDFPMEDIETQLKFGAINHGKITKETQQDIITGVSNSPVMKRKLKNIILQSLKKIDYYLLY